MVFFSNLRFCYEVCSFRTFSPLWKSVVPLAVILKQQLDAAASVFFFERCAFSKVVFSPPPTLSFVYSPPHEAFGPCSGSFSFSFVQWR